MFYLFKKCHGHTSDIRCVRPFSFSGYKHRFSSTCFCWHSFRTTFFVTVSRDKAVAIWDPMKYSVPVIHVANAHDDFIVCCEVIHHCLAAKRGRVIIATGGNDKVIKIWDFTDSLNAYLTLGSILLLFFFFILNFFPSQLF